MNRRITNSAIYDEPIEDMESKATLSQPLDRCFNIDSGDKFLIAWGGVLTPRPGECLTEFQTDAEYAILFINKGTLRVTIDGKPLSISQDQMLLVWPKEKCAGIETITANLKCQWLSFAIDHSSKHNKQVLIRVPRVSNVENPALVAELFSILTNEYHSHQSYRQGFHPLFAQGPHYLLMSILSRVSPSAAASPVASSSLNVVVERATDYIRANMGNPITTSDVARALDCSDGYLRRAFRKTCGCGPGDHLLKVRMQNARELLATSRLSIGEIAQECGFVRLSYFSRVFTSVHGVTPSKYRANHSRQYVVSGI